MRRQWCCRSSGIEVLENVDDNEVCCGENDEKDWPVEEVADRCCDQYLLAHEAIAYFSRKHGVKSTPSQMVSHFQLVASTISITTAEIGRP